MILKFKLLDFTKEIEVPEEIMDIEDSPRLTLAMYNKITMDNNMQLCKWVFVKVSENTYQFSHVEDVE